MKTYTDQIAEILVHAPPAPALHRKAAAEHATVSEETKAKLILIHAAYATYGHPLHVQHQM